MTPEGLAALAGVERPSNPFPGLRPFEFGESHLYFGREGQSDQLIRKLAATRFVAVVGTSGSGKSSLVRAGLLPDLFSGFMQGAGSHWRVALMRPGNDPLGNLARSLNDTGVFGSEIEENAALQTVITEATLRRGGLGLVEAVRQNRMPQNESLLVVVDQFEELFRFARRGERAVPIRGRGLRQAAVGSGAAARAERLRRADDALGLPRRLFHLLGLARGD
jgi:ABC-type dipeptide/oligopeptide/nickel transport system ATPase component